MREALPWNLDIKPLVQFTNQWLEVTDMNLEMLASLRRKIQSFLKIVWSRGKHNPIFQHFLISLGHSGH